MKKTILAYSKKMAICAIGLSLITIGCNKKSNKDEAFTSQKSNALARENVGMEGLQLQSIVYGEPYAVFLDGIRLEDECLGNNGLCHFQFAVKGSMVGFRPASGTSIIMENIDASFAGNDPLIVYKNTDLPDDVKIANGLKIGQIVPGSYPLVFDAAHPSGYIDFKIIP